MKQHKLPPDKRMFDLVQIKVQLPLKPIYAKILLNRGRDCAFFVVVYCFFRRTSKRLFEFTRLI